MEMSWVIAVLLAAMASFISNLGVTLQKLHHIRAAAADAVVSSSSSGGGVAGGAGSSSAVNSTEYTKGWMWRVGLGLVFFGSLADFAALSFGPQSLVAPLGSLTLVSNVIFAPLLLKETIGHWDVLATGLIVIGSSVAVIFGSHETVTYTVFQLFGFFARWDFLLYAVVMTAYGTLLYMAIQKIERIEREEGVHSPRYLHYKALHRFAYPSLSGTVGAQSVLFAKCFVELLANTFRHWSNGSFLVEESSHPLDGISSSLGSNDTLPTGVYLPPPVHYGPVNQNMFVHWQTYFVFAAMLAAIFAQIKYLNDGLRRFDASYSVPVFTSFWIILSVVSGMIFYREYQGMNGAQCMLFAVGVLITVTGVITLGGREQSHYGHQSVPQEEEEGGDEANGDAQEHHVGHDGSVNQSGDGKHYGRSARVASKGEHDGAQPHAQIHAHIHAHNAQHVDDSLELDLDLDGDLDDQGNVHVNVINPPSGTAAAAAGNGVLGHGRSHGHDVHAHTHPVYIGAASHGGGGTRVAAHHDEESSVTDGAKTVVLEASQRISQAFNKLRGKGALVDHHLPPPFVPPRSTPPFVPPRSTHVPASASSSASTNAATVRRGDVNAAASPDGLDESTDHSAAEDDAADPLIQALKAGGSGVKSSRSSSVEGSINSSSAATSLRKSPRSSSGTITNATTGALAAAAAAAADAAADEEEEGDSVRLPGAAPVRRRTGSFTPTVASLYDPSPPQAFAARASFVPAAAAAAAGSQGGSPARDPLAVAPVSSAPASGSSTPLPPPQS